AKSEGMDFGNHLVAANIVLIMPSALIMRRWDLRGKVSEAETRALLGKFMRRSLGLPAEDGERPPAAKGARRAARKTAPARAPARRTPRRRP
ncbi:MAG: hypothetical protein ACHQF3_13900, partial [Alphaproteobacteria bacterium]